IGGIRSGLPSIFLSGGPQLVTSFEGRKAVMSELDQLVFGSQYGEADISEKIRYLEDNVCPGPGACSLMGTANTMQILAEGIGMSLPGSATVPAVYAEKERFATRTGRRIVEMVKQDMTPEKILSRENLLNGIILTMAIAGSTNAVLHLLSLARELDIDLSLDDFDRISGEVPVISRVIPTGKATVIDLHHAGGVPAIMGELRDHLHHEALSVSGLTAGEIMEGKRSRDPSVLTTVEDPVLSSGGIAVIRGNLAPDGAICRTSTISDGALRFRGPARVFDSDEEAHAAVVSGSIRKGDVVVIRREGPRGAPGMREMMMTTDALVGLGMGQDVFVVTDGRFSGFTEGAAVGHLSPEADVGGPIAVVEEGDIISVDIPGRRVDLELPEEEINRRLSRWIQPECKSKRGILGLCSRTALQAHLGAMLDDRV
ncbi:MAG TPA: dihydroxy-acid dehydratase, partial [Synergistetes bacterium]|nr:dihydroxy-acid dehydratase [Synergistota bacterium]